MKTKLIGGQTPTLTAETEFEEGWLKDILTNADSPVVLVPYRINPTCVGLEIKPSAQAMKEAKDA